MYKNYLRKLYLFCFFILFCGSAIGQSDRKSGAPDDTSTPPGCIPQTATPNIYCDVASSTPNSVAFDFNNAGQTSFSYTYSIDGGPLVSGTHVAPSHFNVPVTSPGQSVEFTLTWVGLCGSPTITRTCSAPCVTTTAPTFAAIAPFCQGSTPPTLPSVSQNGISGTWSPATISNTASGNYIFTPTTPCSSSKTINVVVTPKATPTFNQIPPVCQNAAAPVLPTSSTNSPPITGTWSPAVSTASTGPRTYTFTPNPGQCVVSSPTTMTVNVVSNIAPNFAQIPPICSGSPAPTLATTSPNGVSGSWNPATINTTASRDYVFTPTSGQCASQQTMSIVVTPKPTPTFNPIAPFCNGDVAPLLPSSSLEGINGTWSPATIDNTQTAQYTFTPNTGQCYGKAIIQATVSQPISPGFSDFSFCENEAAPVLPNSSPAGVSGTWSPNVVDPVNPAQYTFTPNEGECATAQTVQSTINEPTLSDMTWTVTDAFTDNQTIIVTAMPSGDYLYQLDFGPLQQSNIFQNVGYGTHTISVYDTNGCASPVVDTNVVVINYPHYFTPNADGNHDYWNIAGLSEGASIFIFDRYGKLLKQMSPKGQGWDGTYLGAPLPASDYWFSAQYIENTAAKEFRAHFSLKR